MDTLPLGPKARLTKALNDLDWALKGLHTPAQGIEASLNTATGYLQIAGDGLRGTAVAPKYTSEQVDAASDFLEVVRANNDVVMSFTDAARNSLVRAKKALVEIEQQETDNED